MSTRFDIKQDFRRGGALGRKGSCHEHKDLNPVNPNNPKRVAIVISDSAVSTTTGWPVGFWWAELTHPDFYLTKAGYEVEIFSPIGGACAEDAMSNPEDPARWQAEDVISRGYIHDPEFIKLVDTTRSVDEIDIDRFDAIIVAGGQGPMSAFATATNLHHKFVEFDEAGKVTPALCHGVAILKYATLSNGEPLVKDKTVTGFANIEEDSARARGARCQLHPGRTLDRRRRRQAGPSWR